MMLYPFQQQDVTRLMLSNLLLLSECGIGKTVEAIAAIRARRLYGREGPVLILCNNMAKLQWSKELQLWDPGVPVVVCGKAGRWPEGIPPIQEYFHPRKSVYVVAHHEALSLPKDATARKRRTYRAPEVWSKYVWESIIVDEIHKYANRKNSRVKWLRSLDGLHKLGLSATLYDRLPSDLWAPLNWIEPKDFPSYWDFRDEWSEEDRFAGCRVEVGIKSGCAKAFARMLQPHAIRRSKRDPDVKPDLPPIRTEVIELEMEPNGPQERAYNDIANADDILVKFRDQPGDWHLMVPNVLAAWTRLKQVATYPPLIGLNAPSIKYEWLKEYVEDNRNEAMIIFTEYRDLVMQLSSELGCAYVVGGEQYQYEDWLEGKVPILVGTIASVGESLNLNRASTAIFIDRLWSSRKMTQAYDRIDRINNTESKRIIHLLVKGTLDEYVWTALQEKWSIQEMIYTYLKRGANDGRIHEELT